MENWGKRSLMGIVIIGLIGPTAIGFGFDRLMGTTPLATALFTLPGVIITSIIITLAIQARYEALAPSEEGTDAGEEES